jgi:hypothetical protein
MRKLQAAGPAHVRFESLADITARQSYVRFTPKSGHQWIRVGCPLRAKSEHCVDPSDKSDGQLAALRNFPDGSINVLALGTHEGE